MDSAAPSTTPVLVVGGGPSGVTLGIELLRRGVPCRVIDRAGGPLASSRAFTLHARTLELFEPAGVTEQFLARGQRNHGMDYHFPGEPGPVPLMDFAGLETRYPFMLILGQHETEEVLRRRLADLGGDVEWGTTLRSLSRAPDGRVTARLEHGPDGRTETVRTDWLVGCDGVRSTVRAQLGLPYDGEDYAGTQQQMFDVPLDGLPLADDRIHCFVSDRRLFLVVKLPGPHHRVVVSDLSGTSSPMPPWAALQALLDAQFGPSVHVGVPAQATTFHIGRRLAPSYRRGCVLLAGDAAHCHSPAGGQGMNVAIQDALNLGWKLALVARGESHPSLLDSYERERRPIAEQVIRGSHALRALMADHGTSVDRRRTLTQEPGYRRRTVESISGLAYNYRGTVPVPDGLEPPEGLFPGDRAPDVRLTGELRVHDLLRHPGHTLLLVPGPGGDAAAELAVIQDVTRRVRLGLADCVVVRVLAQRGHPAGAVEGAIVVDGDQATRIYGISAGAGACLVRPDGYVAVRCPVTDGATLLSVLGGVLPTPARNRSRDPARPDADHSPEPLEGPPS